MRVALTLAILFISCRPAPPSATAPENLTFRSFRLEGARPAGYGYSVISQRRIWEQFVGDRMPSSSRPSGRQIRRESSWARSWARVR
jgi:hypothetical protein